MRSFRGRPEAVAASKDTLPAPSVRRVTPSRVTGKPSTSGTVPIVTAPEAGAGGAARGTAVPRGGGPLGGEGPRTTRTSAIAAPAGLPHRHTVAITPFPLSEPSDATAGRWPPRRVRAAARPGRS